MVRLTDRPVMTLDVYHGRKTTNATIRNLISLWKIAFHQLTSGVTLQKALACDAKYSLIIENVKQHINKDVDFI